MKGKNMPTLSDLCGFLGRTILLVLAIDKVSQGNYVAGTCFASVLILSLKWD
jgi:hypothetical protein